MADEHNGHPLVKYKGRVLNLLDELKKVIVEDGCSINDHLDADCEVCLSVAVEIKQKTDDLRDFVDDYYKQKMASSTDSKV